MTLLTRIIGGILAKCSNKDNTQDNLGDAVLKQMFGVIELCAYSSYELDLRKRNCINPELNEEYMGLFSSPVPINKWLFSGNMSKRLENIDKC